MGRGNNSKRFRNGKQSDPERTQKTEPGSPRWHTAHNGCENPLKSLNRKLWSSFGVWIIAQERFLRPELDKQCHPSQVPVTLCCQPGNPSLCFASLSLHIPSKVLSANHKWLLSVLTVLKMGLSSPSWCNNWPFLFLCADDGLYLWVLTEFETTREKEWS